MPTTEERLAALEAKLAQLTATTPTEYYTHKYSGEEIDDAVDKIRSGAGEGAVRFDQAQTLTPAQQEQAQHNIGTTWPCNPNLLDNYCFQIWQRYSNGSYSGVPNGSYVPDRWIITSSNGSIISNLIKATSYGGIKNSNGPNCRITQRLANTAQYNGMTLTLSMLKNTGLHTSTKVVSGWADTTDIFAGFSSATAWLNAGETIIAAKLELGPTQTLAHREGDKWVLNEVPEYGEQLRRCQRYCIVYRAGTTLPYLAYPELDGGWYASAGLPTNSMRAIPTNNLGDGKKVAIVDIDGTDATHDDMGMTSWGQNGNMLCLRISGGSHGILTSKFPYHVILKEDLILSADL